MNCFLLLSVNVSAVGFACRSIFLNDRSCRPERISLHNNTYSLILHSALLTRTRTHHPCAGALAVRTRADVLSQSYTERRASFDCLSVSYQSTSSYCKLATAGLHCSTSLHFSLLNISISLFLIKILQTPSSAHRLEFDFPAPSC